MHLDPAAPVEAASDPIDPQADQKIGFAVVGLGKLAQNQIIPGLRTAKGAKLVAVVSGHPDEDFIQLSVDDDGIGIEAEYRERVFKMFSRLHVREEYEGTGIGLAIVQQIAERAGGTAWTEASPLGGSRFCITLPPAPIQGATA